MAKEQVKKQVPRYVSVLIIIGAAITLFLAQSAYWVNHTVFNQQNFTQTTTDALMQESSRDAIAGAVVNRALENRPVVKKFVGERATSVISGLLGSDLSSQAVTALTQKVYAYTTAPNREDIKIDLTAIKTPLSAIVTLVQNTGREVNVSVEDQIPDEIVLLQTESFPDLSGTVKTMLWLGPVFWLSTIGLFTLYIYLGRAQYAKRVYWVGATIVITGLVGVLAIPFIPPPVAAAIPTIELRPVAENLVHAFLAPFKTQMYYMISVALVILLIFSQRFNIMAVIHSLDNKLRTPKPKK